MPGTHTPNMPGVHTPPKYTRDAHPKYTGGAHTHLKYSKDQHTYIHTHPKYTRETDSPTPHPATQPFTPVPASRRGWGVGRPRGDAGSGTRPLALSLERKRVTAWSGGPVVPSQAMPWEGLSPRSRDVLISFCRQRKWRRGT